MQTLTEKNHALINCKSQLETIIELYKRSKQAQLNSFWDDLEEVENQAREMALDVCWKSDDWQAVGSSDDFMPTKGRVLLSTGGPACQVICDLDNWADYATNPEIQWQDWGTPWTTPSIKCDLELDFDTANDALEWFINRFCWCG